MELCVEGNRYIPLAFILISFPLIRLSVFKPGNCTKSKAIIELTSNPEYFEIPSCSSWKPAEITIQMHTRFVSKNLYIE